jgi:DNA-binding LacI/PurR family transcriptional regulator
MPYMPSAPECGIAPFRYEDIFSSRSTMRQLAAYDGILWSHPSEKIIPQILKINKEKPGVIINRAVPDADFIATEFAPLFCEEVSLRLKEHPEATPYFLSSINKTSYIHDQRLKGFTDACRRHKRFYEQLKMPEKFQEKFDALEKGVCLSSVPRPIMIFADDWSHTGAMARWAYSHDLEWRKDLLYMDFENTEHEHVFGVKTTTILQDFNQLSKVALEALVKKIRNPGADVSEFISPSCRHAGT